MLMQQQEKLQTMIRLVNNMSIDPDVQIDYYIPDVLTTVDKTGDFNDPYVQFSYDCDGIHTQHFPLKKTYLEKTPEDLANLITFSLEQFTGEIDARQYGAQ